jgi:rSAM/selenodomain-associated transferase 2
MHRGLGFELWRSDGELVTTISAIIPTWLEEHAVGAAVAGARAIADEVIVADGGSADQTAAIAAERGARVVCCAKGRGAQLAAGARAASGDVLLFLHADAELGPEARDAILSRLQDPRVIGGNFLLEFTGPSRFAPLFSCANDLRRRVLRIYYGDSAIFVRRAVYEELGGFRPFPIFEDHDFVQRMERHGRTAYIRDLRVRVSSRRYEDKPLRTLINWALLQALYSFGKVEPERLARLYADVRAPTTLRAR